MENSKVPLSSRPQEVIYNLFVDQHVIFKERGSEKRLAINKNNKTWFYIQKNTICPILRKLYFKYCKQAVSSVLVNTVYELIEAISEDCTDEIDVVNSLMQTDQMIVYDIKGSEKYVRVTENNVEVLEKNNSNIIFSPSVSSTQAISPNLNIDDSEYSNIIKDLFGNLKHSLLFSVYLCSLFLRDISHPLLIISGEYGAAKTTFSRMIAKIIDYDNGEVTTMPKTLDDVATVIFNKYFTAFDNISYINREVADLLCMATTGGAYQRRKLYTDTAVSSMYLHNPVLLNGLNLSFPYSDLMDRAIVLQLNRILPHERMSEEAIWQKFFVYLPDILGCIFSLISKAIPKIKQLNIEELPRLADFALWGYAISDCIKPGLGDEFLREYQENTNQALSLAAENNPLLNTLSILMNDIDYWEGTSTELLKALEEVYHSTTIAKHLPRSFPTTSNVLSRRLNVLQNDLKNMGLDVCIGRDTVRYIIISKLTN